MDSNFSFFRYIKDSFQLIRHWYRFLWDFSDGVSDQNKSVHRMVEGLEGIKKVYYKTNFYLYRHIWCIYTWTYFTYMIHIYESNILHINNQLSYMAIYDSHMSIYYSNITAHDAYIE